ncbi:torsin-1A-interacting protein 2-like isoform X2 [Centropristis striata]|uniref:torsin-1A-interacting protein 2-like isoform X2 n=1 Tax=Centropristis striata TaxID=184440 RepID=UPI0027DED0BD|nr:torsin-1A-interacting protein 2-like isoform X2 [Centropristis striata]
MAEQDTDQHHTAVLNNPIHEVPSSKDMAEQDTDQHHTAEEEPESTKMDQVSPSENKRETVIDPNVKQQLAEDGDPTEESMKPPTEGSSPQDEDTTANVKSSTPLQPDEGSHGDYKTETPRKEQQTVKAEEISGDAGEKIEQEKNTQPTLDDGEDDQVDGPDEGTPDTINTNTEAEDAPKEEKDYQESTLPVIQEDLETIGPIIQEAEDAEPEAPVVISNLGGKRMYLMAVVLGVVFAILLSHLQPEPQPQKDDVRQIDIFLRQLEKVKTRFPHQRTELWSRSKIHLLRHLQTAQPTEPVSLILTAGHRAERTLHCLAQSLATAFSSSLNASVLHIDGASKASQDSDQVKLDIDSKLQGAFEGDKPVAVIDRFEELPPGSTLIFYRYCDHENAAYKKTCLIFTVLLGEEEEIPAETRLSTVEEMVDDHLQKKFLSEGHPVSFDRMDLDKYGGLWSRISHLILPVAAEDRVEHEGC